MEDKILKFQNQIDKNITKIKIVNKTQQDIFFNAQNKNKENLYDIKKNFFHSLRPPNRKLSRIHKGGGVLLRLFDHICRENNLKYWIMAGTLLGAVRADGPIPWDDDVDIGMLAEDYYKFFELIKDGLFPDIHLEVRPRLGKKQIHFKHRLRFKCNENKSPFNNGVGSFIDIFIHNYCDDVSPDTLKSMRRFRRRIRYRMYKSYYFELFKYDNSEPLRERIFQILKEDADIFFNKEYFTSKEKDRGIAFSPITSTGWFTEKFSFPVEDYFPLKDIDYSDFKVMVMKNSEEILSKSYGDIYYMPNDLITHKHLSIGIQKKWLKEQHKAISKIKKQYGW